MDKCIYFDDNECDHKCLNCVQFIPDTCDCCGEVTPEGKTEDYDGMCFECYINDKYDNDNDAFLDFLYENEDVLEELKQNVEDRYRKYLTEKYRK